MITNILIGDIVVATNNCDIIIGMNTELGEASALGRRVLKNTLPPPKLIDLGTVLTFKFDNKRLLHMLICHSLFDDGWKRADQFVRVGLDHLWVTQGERNYGIVQVGRGAVGKRDGADPSAILAAMTSSYLPMDLYVRGDEVEICTEAVRPHNVLEFVSGFSPTSGALVVAA